MNNNAKFYMPFAALKGYEEAIIEASKSKTKHKILLADKEEILNNLIKTIKVNDLNKIYFKDIYELEVI